MKRCFYKNLLILSLLIIVLAYPTIEIHARTVDDIQNEIDQKTNKLDQLNADIMDAKKNLDASTVARGNAQGKLKTLEAETAEINDKINYNELKTQQLEEKLRLKKLEMKSQNKKQDKQIKSSYLSWKSSNYLTILLGSGDFFKTAAYYDSISNDEQISIKSLARELNGLKSDFKTFTSEKEALDKQIASLNEQRISNEAEVAQINTQINSDSARLASSRNQISSIQSVLGMLQEEQKILIEAESRILAQGGTGTQPIVPGEYYFTGVGNDNVQGHGVGLSQLGALGAALAGWNYKQIAQFYFQGTSVIKYSARTNIPVSGYGNLDIEKYIAGLGEVPSNSCEDLGIKFGERDFWSCWPKAAIKAQLITARSYALNYTRNGDSICTTAACQVYWGSDAKASLALETEHEIVAMGGVPINALYSAQNNQGAGTSNNETVWSNREGVGYPKSYFRAVNDNGFYYPAVFDGCGGGDCARWGYRTNSYTLPEIQGMLEWSSISPDGRITTDDKTFILSVLNDIGTLKSITFERDQPVAGGGSSLGRARYTILTGTSGTRRMAGWFFKALWNIWIYNVNPSGEQDLIYSKSYFFRSG